MNKSHIISKYSKEREILFHLPSYSFDELLLRIIMSSPISLLYMFLFSPKLKISLLEHTKLYTTGVRQLDVMMYKQ